MSDLPAELRKKCEGLQTLWADYLSDPDFELFVEFGVSLSSFSDFLQGKGLSGLHKMSHGLEQRILTLFEEVDRHQISSETLNKVNQQIDELLIRANRFVEGATRINPDRRVQQTSVGVAELLPTHKVWFVGSEAGPWRALMTQLKYFNIDAQAYHWNEVPTKAEEPTLVLLDTLGLPTDKVCQQVADLRTRFSASKILAHGCQGDFTSLKATLRVGCDFCFPDATAHAVLLAKIIELCSNEEESPYRVLVVEDSLTASKVIQRTLARSDIESHAVTDPAQVLTGLREFQPDLILMDMYMPDCTGVEATRVIRQHAEFLSTPVIYLSGDGDMALQVDALRLGGDHFLTKPFNPVFLNAVVKSKIERYRALRRTMLRDGLTGLFNHRTLKEKLAAALATARASGSPLSVAMTDIDHFKSVNDRYGHPMGDQVIRSLAWLLKQRLRKTDIVGRYGGEEFMVILPNSTTQQAFEVLDRIRHDFSLVQYAFEDTWFHTTFSAGVSQFPAMQGAEALIKDADEALYDAKHSGRNCVNIRG